MQEQIIGLLNPVIALIYATGFTLLWWRNRQDRATLAIALANGGSMAAFLSIFLFDNPYIFPNLLVPQTFYMLSSTLLCWGVAHRVGQKLPLTVFAAIGVLSLVLFSFASLRDNFIVSLFLMNSCHGLMFVMTTQLLARAAPRNFLDRLIVWIAALSCAQYFIRPAAVVMMDGDFTPAEYTSTVYYASFVVFAAITSVTFFTTLIAAVLVDQFQTRERNAETDLLTGLRVRRAFEDDAIKKLDRAIDADVELCMIVADIDNFKQINDIWGHQTGDVVIGNFGKLLAMMTRDSDVLGRIGGEEFCLLIWRCSKTGAYNLAERIRNRLATMVHEGLGDEIRVTASFGVAEWHQGEGYGQLFARADAALYAAKKAGRNATVLAEMHEDSDGHESEASMPPVDAGSRDNRRIANG